MRKSLGLGRSAVLTAEQVGGRIILTPAVVVETEIHSNEQVAAWDRADEFGKGERDKLFRKLKKSGVHRLFADANVPFTAAHDPGG